ncbi:FadR/GntR family transcriptional regulator [Streptomyces malaysiensis]|uniref:FadR family transcriptional regulator n=1 Tax=Streptomyces malaysiensis subsp. samsunensis TaxID=459658 RepID=A0A9X2LZR0_STRMQ|nr:FadR/GntR family transcriptional regulator [Streptomyces samsunensis]MCQ8832225.1 FadR family transcriptional regulator [Streptomyces samsunensis]
MSNSQARPPRLSTVVADQIQKELFDDHLQPGDRLPTEAELSERYQVSRSVVREAGRILDQRGLVDIRPGRGMIVAPPDGSRIVEQYEIMLGMNRASFAQLMETRLVIEVEIARLAAARRSGELVEAMRATIERAAAHPDDYTVCMDEDVRFHELMSQASGNPFFAFFIDPVNTCLRNSYTEVRGYLAAQPATLAEHREILDAIERGDADGARTAARNHLTRVVEQQATLVPKETD